MEAKPTFQKKKAPVPWKAQEKRGGKKGVRKRKNHPRLFMKGAKGEEAFWERNQAWSCYHWGLAKNLCVPGKCSY